MTDREKLISIIEDCRTYVANKEELVECLIANGVTVPVRCKDCKHWIHMEGRWGDCINRRFRLEGHADPTMNCDEFCALGERKDNE